MRSFNVALRGARSSARAVAAPALRSSRFYSIKAAAASASKLQGLDPKKLTIQETTTPKSLSKPEDLVFGKTFTGMMAHPRLSPTCHANNSA